MAKATATNKRIINGTKFSGAHKKNYGPKEQKPKTNRGQG
tara:strand:- start:4103 stop:4222 length:120 start_codon:yes stop_codon:yes gene_type:complete